MEYMAKIVYTNHCARMSEWFGTREETNHWVYEKLKGIKYNLAHVEIHSREFDGETDLIKFKQTEYFYEW